MQELVEMIRRDHAHLAELAAAGDDERYGDVLAAHRSLEEGTVEPLADQLGVNALDEWEEARRHLDAALAGDRAALAAHAEQMEQVLLPRLTAELDEADLSDATRELMRRHEELGLGPAAPSAIHADPVDDVGDSSRPAGATGG